MLLCCLIIDVISDFIYYFQQLAMFVFWSGYGILFFFFDRTGYGILDTLGLGVTDSTVFGCLIDWRL